MSTEETVKQATDQILDLCRVHNSYPMWTVTDKVSKLSPNPRAKPVKWSWNDMRKILMDTAAIVPESMAERRAMMMVNPGIPSGGGPSPYTTDTLYAGFQTVLPGETAPAHRHMAYAVRLILESEKGFTSVAGHKIYLEPGDLVLTPSWQWHYHGNDGSKPTIWVDCLDIPVHVFGRINFLELYEAPKVPDLVTEGSPFHFKWTTALEALQSQDKPHMVHHYQTNGNHFSKTVSAQAERIQKGYSTPPLQETCSLIYVVNSGRGSTKIKTPSEEVTVDWQEKDVFVVPAWSWVEHRAGDAADAYLCALTDRALNENLGLYRKTYPSKK